MIPANLNDLNPGHIQDCWRAGRQPTWNRIDSYARNLRYLDTEEMADHILGSDSDLIADDREVWVSNNQMAANMRVIIAAHTSRTPSFQIPAFATDDAAWEAARLAESLLEACWREKGWEHWRMRLLWFAYASGTAGVWVDWDPVNETTIETLCSVDEMTFEPGCIDASRARWGIKQQLLPPAVVQAMYPAHWPDPAKPPSANAFASDMEVGAVRNRENRYEGGGLDLTGVYTLYLRPTPIQPEGCFAVLIDNKIVEKGPWPFPFTDRLPVAILKQLPYNQDWFGKTIIDDCRPIQGMIDRVTSFLLMGVRDMAAPILQMPQSMAEEAQKLDGSPGQRVFFPDGDSRGASYVTPGSWQSDPLQRHHCVEDGTR